MSVSASKPIPVVKVPYRKKIAAYPALMDDWGYFEGRPTPALSPLMPFNTVPWWNRRWQYDKIVKPYYGNTIKPVSNLAALRGKFSSPYPINSPSLVKDFHIIAIRKQIEQLFSPMFGAHLVVRISDTMNIPPCFWIRHGRFQKSWWGHGSENGTVIDPGHVHFFREGIPTGSLSAHAELSITNSSLSRWGGSITGIEEGQDYRASFGNYYIVNVEYEWEVEEYWRKMVLEDWSIIKGDYMCVAPTFLMPTWGGWAQILQSGTLPTGRAVAFAIDLGQMWQPLEHPDGAYGYPLGTKTFYSTGDGNHKVTHYLLNETTPAYTGPHYTSCSRPYKEGRIDSLSGGGSTRLAGLVQLGDTKFKSVEGFNCGILTGDMTESEPPNDPGFPSDITRPGRIFREDGTQGPIYKVADNKFQSYNSTATISYKKSGSSITVTPSELSKESSHLGASFTHVAHCKGAKLTPRCYVTIVDFLNRYFRIPVDEVEVYYE